MKKRTLLIIAMIALLACLFAVSASAENALKPQTSNAYGDLSFFDESISVGRTDPKYGFTPYIDAEGTTYARVVVGDGTTFYTFPTAYVLSNTTIYGEGQINTYVRDLTSLNSAMETATGTNPNWNEDNIYRIEMPYSNIRFNGGGQQGFQGYDNLIEIWLQPNSHVKDQNKTMMFWKCFALETIHNLDTFTFRNGCLSGSFQECKKLKNITLGYSAEVTNIGSNAFVGCTALESINFVEAFPNVTAIGESTFNGCSSLTTINPTDQAYSFKLQAGITSIGKNAFNGCKAVKYISIPAGVTFVGQAAFMDCTALEFVEFNNNQNDVDFSNCQMFMGCTNLKAMCLPDNTDYLTNRFFSKCGNIQAVYLPSALVNIESNGYGEHTAFYLCEDLYFVNEKFKVTDENGDFYGDSFEMPARPDVYFFPSSLAKIFDRDSGIGFASCYSLNPTMVFPTTLTRFWINDGVFYECGKTGSKFTVVFLGDMTDVRIGMRDSRAKGVSYVFANVNDKTLSDVNIIDSNAGYTPSLNGDEAIYFCHSNKYFKLYNLGGSSDATQYTEELVADKYITGVPHFSNPKVAVVTPADCINPRKEVQTCFCGADMGEKTIGEALGHDHDIANGAQVLGIAYNNGYLKSGTKTVKCIRCDVTSTDQTIGAPVFGVSFSAKEEGTAFGILVQYNVAKEVLAEYYENTGKNLTVGVASIMKKNVNEDGTLLDATGNTTQSNVVTTPIAEQGLSAVMIKITGATSLWEAYSSESIYVLGYVTDGTTLEYVGFAGGEASSSTSLNNMDAYLISDHLPEKEEA